MAIGRNDGFCQPPPMKNLIAFSCALLLSTSAFAEGRHLSEFFGRWLGEGVAETEVGDATERQSRGLEVIVRNHSVGFQLCWSTTRRERDGNNRKTFAMMLFAPSAQGEGWAAVFSADGSETASMANAVLDGDTLRVTNRATNERGETEVQVYERSLRRGGMDLHFTRFDNGRLARTVQGRLEKADRAPGDAAPWC